MDDLQPTKENSYLLNIVKKINVSCNLSMKQLFVKSKKTKRIQIKQPHN